MPLRGAGARVSEPAPRVLILGWSSIARRRVAPALARLGASGVDVASRTQEVARPAGLGGRTFGDYAEALRDSTARIVYVSTRNHEHAEHAAAALASGRHVVIDKPAALSAGETAALIDQAAAQRLLLAEATVWMWHPQIAAAARLVEAHGPVERITAAFTYPPLPAGNFRHVAAHGGGALWDLGPYAVTPGRVFLGDEAPSHIDAHAGAGDPETSFSVLMRYPSGGTLAGHFSVNAPYVNRLELQGPRLALTIERAFTTPPDLVMRVTGEAGGERVAIDTPPGDAFAAFLADVAANADGGDHERFARLLIKDAEAMARLRRAARRTAPATPAAPDPA